jgi:hypothetical protein
MGYKLFFLVLLFLNVKCTGQMASTSEKRKIINFSGYDWYVKSSYSDKTGPGPNYFSDSENNVWVDNQGRLHLKITYRNSQWNCAEVIMLKSYGHNKYVFYLDSRPDLLDMNIVLGLFTYKNDLEEIDIEFSRWSIEGNQEAQYAIQPSDIVENKTRFSLNLNGDSTTHFFDWRADKISFASYYGHILSPVDKTDIINEWTYTGNSIPPDSDEKLEINLWLFRGRPPSDNMEAEVIINRVEIYK